MRMNQRFVVAMTLMTGICGIVTGCASKPEATVQGPIAKPKSTTPETEVSESAWNEKVSPTGIPQLKNPPESKTIGKLKTIQGETVTLEALHGKVVILDFWATWCGPCRMTIPILKELHEEYSDKGLVVIGISDETVKQVKPFAESMDMNYKVVADPDGSSTWQVNYAVESLPTMAVIDRKGKVRLYEAGLDMRPGMGTHDRLKELIPQLLSEK